MSSTHFSVLLGASLLFALFVPVFAADMIIDRFVVVNSTAPSTCNRKPGHYFCNSTALSLSDFAEICTAHQARRGGDQPVTPTDERVLGMTICAHTVPCDLQHYHRICSEACTTITDSDSLRACVDEITKTNIGQGYWVQCTQHVGEACAKYSLRLVQHLASNIATNMATKEALNTATNSTLNAVFNSGNATLNATLDAVYASGNGTMAHVTEQITTRDMVVASTSIWSMLLTGGTGAGAAVEQITKLAMNWLHYMGVPASVTYTVGAGLPVVLAVLVKVIAASKLQFLEWMLALPTWLVAKLTGLIKRKRTGPSGVADPDQPGLLTLESLDKEVKKLGMLLRSGTFYPVHPAASEDSESDDQTAESTDADVVLSNSY